MTAYYNENDPYAAAWIKNLISAGRLVRGDVDERSIVDVRGDDLRGYQQCHFFAGIGGWPYALSLAGWPDDREVWTGSCPCQPFSSAGQRKGHADERHLWPAFYNLIAERRPAIVFGEQVAGKLGREWLAAVRSDLEPVGYAFGGADMPAASVGAPHIRQRLFWVADRAEQGWRSQSVGSAGANRRAKAKSRRLCDAGIMADADVRDACPERLQRGGEQRLQPKGGGVIRQLGDAGSEGLPLRQRDELPGAISLDQGRAAKQSGRSFWADLEWLPCTDGKARPTQPGIFPLAHGVPARVGKLRAAGNAIVPQAAAEFIKAMMDCRP